MWNNLKHQNSDKTDCDIGSHIGNPSFRAREADRIVPVAFAFFYFEENNRGIEQSLEESSFLSLVRFPMRIIKK